MLSYKIGHKYLGYLVVFTVQVTLTLGFLLYVSITGRTDTIKYLLVCGNISLFVLVLSIGEIVH